MSRAEGARACGWRPATDYMLLENDLVLSVNHMNTKVSGRESVNGAAEPGRDLLETDVFDVTESVRAKNHCYASRFETADRAFINFLEPFGPLRL